MLADVPSGNLTIMSYGKWPIYRRFNVIYLKKGCSSVATRMLKNHRVVAQVHGFAKGGLVYFPFRETGHIFLCDLGD